jgi:hypothetical protein
MNDKSDRRFARYHRFIYLASFGGGLFYGLGSLHPDVQSLVIKQIPGRSPFIMVGAMFLVGLALFLCLSLGLAPKSFLRSPLGQSWLKPGEGSILLFFRLKLLLPVIPLLMLTGVIIEHAFLDD